MKQPLVGYICCILACIALCTCSNGDKKMPVAQKIKQPPYHKKNFDSLVKITEKGMAGGVEFYGGLLLTKAFVEVFEHSSNYFSNASSLLAREPVSTDDLIICIMGMQNLNATDYARLCGIYVKLYQRNKISEGMLETSITPNFLHKHIIAENYTNPAVRRVLNSILNGRPISGAFKKLIEDILSGDCWRGIESGPEN